MVPRNANQIAVTGITCSAESNAAAATPLTTAATVKWVVKFATNKNTLKQLWFYTV